MTWTLTPEQVGIGIGAVAAVLSSAGVVLKKCGLITFGKPIERRNCPTQVQRICGDHQTMRADIEAIKINSEARIEKLNKISDKQDAIDVKLDSLSEDVAKISGYLQGRNGFHWR